MKVSHPLLDGYPVVMSIPVLWSDEDAFGHVNNLTFLRWAEAARVEYLRRIPLWPSLPPSGPGPILASLKGDYRMQVTSPDTVLVGARVTSIGNSSFRMEHVVISTVRNAVAAEVDSTLVLVDYSTGKAVRISDETRDQIAALEGKAVPSYSAV
jgi:acyl-CoA thioester hydrolase